MPRKDTTKQTREERLAKQRAYREEHRAELAAKGRAYYAAHREEQSARARAYQAAHYAAHREERNAKSRAYRAANRAANRAELVAISRAYHAANRAEQNAKARAYRVLKREEVAAQKRARLLADPETIRTRGRIYKQNRRALKIGNGGNYTLAEWRALCAWFGNVCLRCGVGGTLSPDHVVPLIKGGANAIANIQPLCLTCNLQKGVDSTDYRDEEMIAAFLVSRGAS